MAVTSRVIVIILVAVVCFAVIMAGILTRTRKQSVNMNRILEQKPGTEGKEKNPQNPLKAEAGTANSKKATKSWANVFLPFYSLGILAYVMFVVGKIMNRRVSQTKKGKEMKMSWSKPRASRGNAKTKITMFEIRQLEDKLQETERAMQHILVKTHEAATIMNRQEINSSDDDLHKLQKRARRSYKMEISDDNNSESDYDDDEESSWEMSFHDKEIGLNKFDNEDQPISPLLRRRRFNVPKQDIQVEDSCAPPVHSRMTSRKKIGRKLENADSKSDSLVQHGSGNESNSEECDSLNMELSELQNDINAKEQEEDVHISERDLPEKKEKAELLKTFTNIQETMDEVKTYLDYQKAQIDQAE